MSIGCLLLIASGNIYRGRWQELSAEAKTVAEDHRPSRDLYGVLGVAPTASAGQIASAYRRLVRELHPDTRPRGGEPPEVTRLGDVLAAYEVLSRPERRAAYDGQRKQDFPTPTAGAVPIAVHYRHAPPPSPTAPLRAGPVHFHPAPGRFSPVPWPAGSAVFDELLVVIERLRSRPWSW